MISTLPSSNKSDICDFLEYRAFIEGECDIEEYYISDEDDEVSSSQIDDVKTILQSRLRLYAPYIPFQLSRNKVVSAFQTESDRLTALHYIFCVHYSLNGAQGVGRDDSTLFELIVDIALKEYLNTTQSVLTSFGNNDQTIKEKIHEVLQMTNERLGDISLMPPHAKDGGIDIITFKSLDNRGNQLIVLTDATLGRNWSEKRVASKLEHWIQYIHFKTNPLPCLALTKIIPLERFHYASRDNGLLFDRTRIVRCYSQHEDEEVQNKLKIWWEVNNALH